MDIRKIFQELLAPLFSEQVRKLEQIIQQPKPKAVYTDDQLCDMLGVSKKTTQTWRFSGKIGFSQVGRVIIYQWDDIEDFLKTYHKKPFKK